MIKLRAAETAAKDKCSTGKSFFLSLSWHHEQLLRIILIKSGEFSVVSLSRVVWFGKSFHRTTSTPSWSSVCIFKSQLRTDPDLSPGKTGFGSTSVYQLRKKQNALLLDFFFFISYCKMPTLQAFLQCKQSKHPSGSASYPKQSREKHDIQKSLVIHPPSQATKYFMFHTLIKHFFL